MPDIRNVQLIVQLIDTLEKITEKLEKSSPSENSTEFAKAQNEILDIQKKISSLLANHGL